MNNFYERLRPLLFFKRYYTTLTDDKKICIFSVYVTLASMAVQIALDWTLTLGYKLPVVGSLAGCVAGAVCYLALSSVIKRRARLSIGVDSTYVNFTLIFTLMGAVGPNFPT